LRREGSILALQ